MEVTISQFRKELFTFAEAALRGEKVTITWKGQRLELAPEVKGDFFSRITPMKMSADPEPGDEDFSLTSARLFAEMEKEWEEDWNTLGEK